MGASLILFIRAVPPFGRRGTHTRPSLDVLTTYREPEPWLRQAALALARHFSLPVSRVCGDPVWQRTEFATTLDVPVAAAVRLRCATAVLGSGERRPAQDPRGSPVLSLRPGDARGRGDYRCPPRLASAFSLSCCVDWRWEGGCALPPRRWLQPPRGKRVG